ncbi:hypothetical protein [Natrinema caseinilyticum]|uniref:hypothetical protein n=1 Tax=Natrinema caseinilyticum TaxID=2961570 RepID=UPI0020C52772|nr:hypothetical protein [Natrinema caseinilyticum]
MTADSPADDAPTHDRLEQLESRIDDLETENESLGETIDQQADRIDTVEDELETVEAENERLRDANETLRDALEKCKNESESLQQALSRVKAITDAALKKAGANKDRIAELQSRELEKGAHLHAESVDPGALEERIDYLERFTKDGSTYVRLPDSADPLDRDGPVALAHGDLLPIQQLARMDDDMLRSMTNSLPSRLAAKLWRARTDPGVGDNPWREGCKGVREYVKASDMKHWIRRQETGVSDAYAKKLVSRTIDALLELSKNRLAIRKRTERKNGLSYTERRVVLKADASIPGETTRTEGTQETAGVHGQG